MIVRFSMISVLLMFSVNVLFTEVAADQQVKTSRFSGKSLPRFESLRYSAVHGRQGPHLDHAIIWRYERVGLPILVIRETYGWRRVRDPDGDEVWIQARMLSEKRTVIITRDTILRRRPAPDASGRAMLKENVIARLESCRNEWCQVVVGKKRGWVRDDFLWGAKVTGQQNS